MLIHTQVEEIAERLRFARWLLGQSAPSGMTFKTVLRFDVEDVNALPSDFVIRTPNERLIRETFCVDYKEGMDVPAVPGIRFTVEKQPVSTGR
jgi:hypothetical protein